MSMEAWEDRIFAFGRFIRSILFFYMIIKLCIGVFYRINPEMVNMWFSHELDFNNSLMLLISPVEVPMDEVFGNTLASLMGFVSNNKIIFFIITPLAIFFALEHTLWWMVFGPTASLLKDLMVVGVIVLFLVITLKSRMKEEVL